MTNTDKKAIETMNMLIRNIESGRYSVKDFQISTDLTSFGIALKKSKS